MEIFRFVVYNYHNAFMITRIKYQMLHVQKIHFHFLKDHKNIRKLSKLTFSNHFDVDADVLVREYVDVRVFDLHENVYDIFFS